MFSSLKDIIFHTKRAFFSNAQGEHLSILMEVVWSLMRCENIILMMILDI